MTLSACDSQSPSAARKLVARVSWFFLATAIQGGISFVMVPVITYVLGPREFGIFALMTGVGGVLSLFGALGAGYLYAEHYNGLSVPNRRELVSTTFWMGAICLVPITGLVLGLWPVLTAYFEALAVIPTLGASLVLVSVIACYPWSLAIEILVLEGRAQLYATIIVSQAIVSALTTVVGLYALEWGIFAIFFGNTFLYFFFILALKTGVYSLPIFIFLNYYLLTDIKKLLIYNDGSIYINYFFKSKSIELTSIKKVQLKQTNSRLGSTVFVIYTIQKNIVFDVIDTKIDEINNIFRFFKSKGIIVEIKSNLAMHKKLKELTI